jgi:hypothetical protein
MQQKTYCLYIYHPDICQKDKMFEQ